MNVSSSKMWSVVAAIVISMLAYLGVHQRAGEPLVLVAPESATPVHDQGYADLPLQKRHAVEIETFKTYRGATEDGSLKVVNGHLIMDREFRRWMDFHLSAVGERTIAEIVHSLEQRLQSLPSPAAQEGLQLLQQYLAYLEALDGYDTVAARKVIGADIEGLRARNEWIERQRRDYFSEAVVTAFFANDEALDRLTIERMALVKEGADQEALAALERELPMTLRVQRQQVRILEQARNINETTASSSPEVLWQKRSEKFGEAAANRLADLDDRQSEWLRRVTDYRQFLEAVEDNDKKLEMINQYKQTHFSFIERKRLTAALSLGTSE
jgi:lipase chaperone LimK